MSKKKPKPPVKTVANAPKPWGDGAGRVLAALIEELAYRWLWLAIQEKP